MNFPLRRVPKPSKTLSVTVGDIFDSPDNAPRRGIRKQSEALSPKHEPKVKRHMRVVVHLDAIHAFVVPICTDDDPDRKACSLAPADLARGVLTHRSFLLFAKASTLSINALERMIREGKARSFEPCPPFTLSRIQAAMRSPLSGLPRKLASEMNLSGPVIRQFTS